MSNSEQNYIRIKSSISKHRTKAPSNSFSPKVMVWFFNRIEQIRVETFILTITITNAHNILLKNKIQNHGVIHRSEQSNVISHSVNQALFDDVICHFPNPSEFPITSRLLSFIIVVFSIVEEVNRIKRQDLTLLYVNICWQLFCWYFIW